VDALSRQIAEKEAQKISDFNELKSQEERDRYVSLLMEQQAAEDREMRNRELQDLRGTWEYQNSLPKNNAPKMGEPIIAENCGTSAVQKFSGEDDAQLDRLRLQKEQMRSWNYQQMAEKRAGDQETKDEEERYANYVKMLTERRGVLEDEEADDRKQWRLSVARDNMNLSVQKEQNRKLAAEREFEEKSAEVDYQLGTSLLCEDTSVAFKTSDGRVRRDGFKGYSKDQVALFYKENSDLIEKKKADQAANDQEAAWVEHSSTLRYLMEENEAQRRAQAQSALMDQRTFVQKQAEEERLRKTQREADRFGSVGPGYFDGFGTSVR